MRKKLKLDTLTVVSFETATAVVPTLPTVDSPWCAQTFDGC